MKKSILSLVFGIATLLVGAQTSDTTVSVQPKTIHKLGLHSGTTSGVGLSYKALFNNKWMLQLVTLPVASQNYKYVNSGVSIKYKFRDYDKWDFYSFAAVNYIFTHRQEFEIYDNYDSIDEYQNLVHGSGGIAIEYGKGEFFKWGFQIGYGIYNIGSQNWQTNLSIGTTIDFSLNSK